MAYFTIIKGQFLIICISSFMFVFSWCILSPWLLCCEYLGTFVSSLLGLGEIKGTSIKKDIQMHAYGVHPLDLRGVGRRTNFEYQNVRSLEIQTFPWASSYLTRPDIDKVPSRPPDPPPPQALKKNPPLCSAFHLALQKRPFFSLFSTESCPTHTHVVLFPHGSTCLQYSFIPRDRK